MQELLCVCVCPCVCVSVSTDASFYFLPMTMLRCTTCSKFSVRIGRAMSKDEQAPLIKAQSKHLNQVLGHRAVCTRLNQLSESSTRPGADLSKGLIKMDIDGADQAKALVPRGAPWAKSPSGDLSATSWDVCSMELLVKIECHWKLPDSQAG